MKHWNSAFNAQVSRVIIVVVQVGAVKIFAAAAAAEQTAQEKGKTGWNSVYHQKLMIFCASLQWNLNVLFFVV
jgi:hypothetical protein